MTATPKPFKLEIGGASFTATALYDTQAQAYSEARRIRALAQNNQPATLTDDAGNTRTHHVLVIRIFRWTPHVGMRIAHARHWSLNDPPRDALKPLPDSWYQERRPTDWNSPAKTA